MGTYIPVRVIKNTSKPHYKDRVGMYMFHTHPLHSDTTIFQRLALIILSYLWPLNLYHFYDWKCFPTNFNYSSILSPKTWVQFKNHRGKHYSTLMPSGLFPNRWCLWILKGYKGHSRIGRCCRRRSVHNKGNHGQSTGALVAVFSN